MLQVLAGRCCKSGRIRQMVYIGQTDSGAEFVVLLKERFRQIGVIHPLQKYGCA
jgi:hypothetical protein